MGFKLWPGRVHGWDFLMLHYATLQITNLITVGFLQPFNVSSSYSVHVGLNHRKRGQALPCPHQGWWWTPVYASVRGCCSFVGSESYGSAGRDKRRCWGHCDSGQLPINHWFCVCVAGLSRCCPKVVPGESHIKELQPQACSCQTTEMGKLLLWVGECGGSQPLNVS